MPSTNPDPPTVVLEAMACGKPVVGYRHGGVCEMVKEGETAFSFTNQPSELSKAIQESLRTEKREQFGKASVKRQRTILITKLYSEFFGVV